MVQWVFSGKVWENVLYPLLELQSTLCTTCSCRMTNPESTAGKKKRYRGGLLLLEQLFMGLETGQHVTLQKGLAR